MKKAKATIAVILYLSKTLANREHPLMIRVCYNGQRKYKSTGLSCLTKFWNGSKREVRNQHPLSAAMNTLIEEELTRLKSMILDFELRGQAYSAQHVIESSIRKAPTRKTLYALFDERISHFRDTMKKYNTATGYRTLLHIVKPFANNAEVELFDVNSVWLSNFEAYLRRQDYADTSIKRFLDAFRALMNHACLNKLIDRNPFDEFRLSRKLDTRTAKRALNIDEMNLLVHHYLDTYYNADPPPNPVSAPRQPWQNSKFQPRGANKLTSLDAEQFALAMFICSYIFQGLALVDLAKLRWKDLVPINILNKDKYQQECALHGLGYAERHKEIVEFYEVNITRTKTQHPTRILVEQSVVRPYMLPFMQNKRAQDPENFVFPIYYDNDLSHQFERLNYATGLFNRRLKRTTGRIGLSQNITFYSARHTYASMLYHSDVSLSLIAQNMGRNPTEIETYLKDFDTDKIIGANKLLWQVYQQGHKTVRTEQEPSHLTESLPQPIM